jgi:hypothetical protein
MSTAIAVGWLRGIAVFVLGAVAFLCIEWSWRNPPTHTHPYHRYYTRCTPAMGAPLQVQRDYGPRRARTPPPDTTSPDPFRRRQQEQAEAAARAAAEKGEKPRNAYVERLLAAGVGGVAGGVGGGAGGRFGAVEVRGDDYFGSVCGEGVWADWGGEVAEAPLPLDARRELARGYSAAVTFMDFQVLCAKPFHPAKCACSCVCV